MNGEILAVDRERCLLNLRPGGIVLMATSRSTGAVTSAAPSKQLASC